MTPSSDCENRNILFTGDIARAAALSWVLLGLLVGTALGQYVPAGSIDASSFAIMLTLMAAFAVVFEVARDG